MPTDLVIALPSLLDAAAAGTLSSNMDVVKRSLLTPKEALLLPHDAT